MRRNERMRGLILLAVPFAVAAGPVAGDTLEEVLAARGVDPGETGDPHLRDKINHAILGEKEKGLTGIAYRIVEGGQFRGEELFLLVRDGPGGAWSRAAISLKGIGAADGICGGELGGPPLHFRRSRGHFYVEFHLSPSASATLVLTLEFVVRGAFCGWILAISPGEAELVLYRESIVHFAPFHPTGLSVYLPGANARRPLYPHEPPGALTRAYAEQVRRAHDEIGIEWFGARNHPDDSKYVTGSLFSYDGKSIAFDDGSRSLALILAFDSRETTARAKLGAHYFGDLAKSVTRMEPGKPVPDRLYRDLLGLLGYVQRTEIDRKKLLWLVEGDPGLLGMVRTALERIDGTEEDPRGFFLSLDPGWGSPATWTRFREIAGLEAGVLEVAFAFRGIAAKESPEEAPRYEERSLADLRRRYPGSEKEEILRMFLAEEK